MSAVTDVGRASPSNESADTNDRATTTDSAARIRRTLEGVLGVPATEGNRVRVLRNGDQIFPAMLEAIDQAEHTIDFLTFVYWTGQVGEEFGRHLCDRAKAGVRVRVLLDAWGSHTMDKQVLVRLEDAGAQVRWFRPLRRLRPGQVNHRTHRKVLITDEAVGFTGGVGIADCWQGDAGNENEWRDTHFRIEGPAVDGLRAAFLDNWAETGPELFDESIDRFPDQPQPGSSLVQCVRGASEVGWSDVATLFRALLQLANERIRITTAYFVPDAELTDRLCAATARGVEIDILLPGPHADKRFVQLAGEAEYDRLLECGVRLWHYQPSMIHAKVMTVDRCVASVGSANLNTRSVALDEEINAVVIDDEIVAELDAHFEDDLERSVRIEPGRWERRPVWQRTAERIVTPVRRLF